VDNGFVTKATMTLNGASINVKFVAGSFVNALAGAEPIDVIPWFGSEADADALAQQMVNASESNTLNNTVGLVTNVKYQFAYALQFGDVTSYWNNYVSNNFITQGPRTTQEIKTGGEAETYLWAFLDTSGSSSVPEPSTAIAMGLLGIVGFAGNRRRRTVA
jgi:hypothetical protein